MEHPERDEPEAEADDAGDLELEPDEVEDVKGGTAISGGGGGTRIGGSGGSHP
jgi:hypothetical protein